MVLSAQLIAAISLTFLVALVSGLVAVTRYDQPIDAATIVVGSVMICLLHLYLVQSLADGAVAFSSSSFVHLGLTLSTGPLGALGGAVAGSVSSSIKLKLGWARGIYNCSNHFLTQLFALCVYRAITDHNRAPLGLVIACVSAGAAMFIVSYLLLGMVINLSGERQMTLVRFFAAHRATFLYSLGYGWASFAFIGMHAIYGWLGFSSVVLQAVILQIFLVLLARRIADHEKQRAVHAKEREGLLERAISASEDERKRIASDLHDGVVQTLAGLAMSLAAARSEVQRETLVPEAAETLRNSVTELRTLMIAIAPPDLDRTGIDVALDRLMAPLRSKGVKVALAVPKALHLTPEQTTLVFRVAQEGVRNIVSHSQATEVAAQLQVNGELSFRLSDNGKGFTPTDRDRRRQEGHVGLSLLVKAVETAGGNLQLDSTPGKGTSLILALP